MGASSALLLAGMFSALPVAYAQDGIVGKYTGMAEVVNVSGRIRHDTLYLVIDQVEGGAVRGTVSLTHGFCTGEYPVKGELDGNKLTLRHSVKGEVKQGCGVNWELTVAGNKLEGKSKSGSSLRFSK